MSGFSYVSSFKGVTPIDVNEGCAQDFAGRIEPHMLRISPCKVTANQDVLCIMHLHDHG